tara:strand:- start:425 stop:634 length:210 start_codon:yes stop_codon:yes gene_type:complete
MLMIYIVVFCIMIVISKRLMITKLVNATVMTMTLILWHTPLLTIGSTVMATIGCNAPWVRLNLKRQEYQ